MVSFARAIYHDAASKVSSVVEYTRSHSLSQTAYKVCELVKNLIVKIVQAALCLSFSGTSVLAFWAGYVLSPIIRDHIYGAVESLKGFRFELAALGAIAIAISVAYVALAHFLALPILLNMVAFSIALYWGVAARQLAEERLQKMAEKKAAAEANAV